MQRRYDLIVIGGGIAGVFASYCGIKHGLKVALVEASDKPNGATARSGGIITRMLDRDEDILLAVESMKLIKELLGRDAKNTLKYGYLSIEEEEDAIKDYKKYLAVIPDIKILYEDEIKDRWPYINIYEDEVGLYSPSDFTVNPKQLLSILWERIRDLGVELISGRVAERILIADRSVKGVLLNDQSLLRSDYVVIAMGAWANEFLSKHGVRIRSWMISIPLYHFKVDNTELIGVWDDENYSYWRPDVDGVIAGGGYDAYPISDPEEGFARPPVKSLYYALELFKYRFNFKSWRLIDCWSGPVNVSSTYSPVAEEVRKIGGLYVIYGLSGYGLIWGPSLAYRLVLRIMS